MPLFAPREIHATLSLRNFQVRSPLSNAALNASIVIGICLHNQCNHLSAALNSAMSQEVMKNGQGAVVILDDSSTDNWQEAISDWIDHSSIVVVHARCGSAARSRNALLDWVDANLPQARWIARLDGDDLFADHTVVGAFAHAGEAANARFVLGSNHLALGGIMLPESNIADRAILQDKSRLLTFIEDFCSGASSKELPSCNLLLRARSGIRYPDVRSAEDHWLVAGLLMFSSEFGLIVSEPVYAIYSLGGSTSRINRRSAHWAEERTRLALAARVWFAVVNRHEEILGYGQEGIVWQEGTQVVKQFYPYAMVADDVRRLSRLKATHDGPIPKTKWYKLADGTYRCMYDRRKGISLPQFIPANIAKLFLIQLHGHGYVTCNIKRSNLLLVDDQLTYIDIGKDIRPFSPSRFLDAAARLYSVAVLGESDYELARRPSSLRQHESLATLKGFTEFYRDLIETLFPHCKKVDATPIAPRRAESTVTLMIKCCAQDAALIENQVRHIVSSLSYPASFKRRVLLVDPFPGPFLRQYAQGNLPRVLDVADTLRRERVIDDVWVAPTRASVIRNTYFRWFGRDDVSASHTRLGAPLFAQLWAFDKVTTPYVLQCDCDVLIGRRDLHHDYLQEMLDAASAQDVVSVGFNIAQEDHGYKPYQGATGQFPPEIRCGLLHLQKLRALRPLINDVKDGQFELMWHRCVQWSYGESSRAVRGGDSRTFYVHPANSAKGDESFDRWRDLVSQGLEPRTQKGYWNLLPTAAWEYPKRDEKLIFLMKGRNTSVDKLRRCFDSLALQLDQRFGAVVIDDGSSISHSWQIPLLLGELRNRVTLIRRGARQGYIRNFVTAITEICVNPESLIVTLDLDDALMSYRVTERLHQAICDGVDLVNGGMFRPDKPLHLYEPDHDAPRQKGGGNVWAHMRGFRKSLFDALPRQYLQVDGQWIDTVTDYAIMVPLVEMAQHPAFLNDLFCYYHQRDPYPAHVRAQQHAIIEALLRFPSATGVPTAVLASGAIADD